MTLNTTPIKKKSTQDKKKKVRQTRPTYEKEMRCFILKELKKKKYHFLDSNVPIMLEDLQKKVIELPKSKHLEEVGHDPKYYHCH